jgi:DNA adenine methylase
MSANELVQPLKWHGGKSYLAKKIVALFPPRCKNPNAPAKDDPGWLHYVEPYAGGLAVLLENDPTGISEVVNDIYSNLTMFWRVLQSERDFHNFHARVSTTPFSSDEFNGAYRRLSQTLGSYGAGFYEKAADFFIVCRQSLAGRMNGFASITRSRTRKGMNEQVSAWLGAIEGLPAVHERLRRVLILNQDALEVIRKENGPRTLFYLDPPYVHSERKAANAYAHEMSDDEHVELLETLGKMVNGRFLLSGYRCPLYNDAARRFSWKRHEFMIDNKAAGGKTKRKMVECVWTNF